MIVCHRNGIFLLLFLLSLYFNHFVSLVATISKWRLLLKLGCRVSDRCLFSALHRSSPDVFQPFSTKKFRSTLNTSATGAELDET